MFPAWRPSTSFLTSRQTEALYHDSPYHQHSKYHRISTEMHNFATPSISSPDTTYDHMAVPFADRALSYRTPSTTAYSHIDLPPLVRHGSSDHYLCLYMPLSSLDVHTTRIRTVIYAFLCLRYSTHQWFDSSSQFSFNCSLEPSFHANPIVSFADSHSYSSFVI